MSYCFGEAPPPDFLGVSLWVSNRCFVCFLISFLHGVRGLSRNPTFPMLFGEAHPPDFLGVPWRFPMVSTQCFVCFPQCFLHGVCGFSRIPTFSYAFC